MIKLLAKWVITALAFLIVTRIGIGITVSSFYTALLLAFFWGLISITLRPILLVLTFPINLLTLGLFSLVVNGFLFWLLGTFVRGFQIDGFLAAIVGALVVSVITWIGEKVLLSDRGGEGVSTV